MVVYLVIAVDFDVVLFLIYICGNSAPRELCEFGLNPTEEEFAGTFIIGPARGLLFGQIVGRVMRELSRKCSAAATAISSTNAVARD